MPPDLAQGRVVVRGAGEMASGVIHHLAVAGYEVIALERLAPTCVRRHVCYAEAIFARRVMIEGITAVLARSADEAVTVASKHRVAVLIDPDAQSVLSLAPLAVIDGRMHKREATSQNDLAPILVGLGPGFVAGENCHAVVETSRGSDLGKVYYTGHPRPYTGVPMAIEGVGLQRVLRSPTDGEFSSRCRIGDMVVAGQVLGCVADTPVVGQIDGVLRGMIHDGLVVSIGQKLGDIDPRGIPEFCYRMSNKAHAIGRGALEALKVLRARVNRR